MPFDVSGKVALISGGASGLGLSFAKELLRNGLKGVTLADVDEKNGQQASEGIKREYGSNKVVFVQTDVTNKGSFEDAFKKTVDSFGHIDILINSAGIFNDSIWEKEVAVNINGVIHGILLGLEDYIPKHKTSAEGVIVNISSVAGLYSSNAYPVYSATKHAIVSLGTAFGDQFHHARTKVRVLTLCPGLTETPLLKVLAHNTLGKVYQDLSNILVPTIPRQKSESVAAALIEIIKNARSGSIWIAENDGKPIEYVVPDRSCLPLEK